MGVALAYILATLSMARIDDAPVRVVAVEIRLPAESDPSLLQDTPQLLAVRKGQIYSRSLVRRSIEVLFATGRFADVIVKSIDEAQGVRLVFELTPVQRVALLRFEGHQALTESELLAASKIKVGSEFFEERAQQTMADIKEVYRQRGYEAAALTLEPGDFGRGLEIRINISEGEPTRIHALRLSGAPGLSLDEALKALKLQLGDILDEQALEAGLTRLRATYRKERFFLARVFPPAIDSSAGKASVRIPAYSGPQFEFRFEGNRQFSADLLQKTLRYDGVEPLDASMATQLARRLEDFYRFRGFHDVRVTPTLRISPNEHSAILKFIIVEGLSLFVREVVFVGNRSVPTARLRELLGEVVRSQTPATPDDLSRRDDPVDIEGRVAAPAFADGPAPDPSTVFVESAYMEAANTMTDMYREMGFLSATVQLAGVTYDVSKQYANARFQVNEGPLALIEQVEWLGLPSNVSLPREDFLRKGQPYRFNRAEELRLQAGRALVRKGYLFGEVEMSAEISPDGQRVRVRYQVSSGPQVHIGKIVVVGAERTSSTLLREQMKLKEGDILDPEMLFDSQRRLTLLGIFRTVTVRLLAPDKIESTKDVAIEVKENPRVYGELGGGYFLAEGPRVTFDWSYPNVGGLAINVSGRGKVHYFGASGPVLTNQADVSDLGFVQQLGGQQTVSVQSRGWLPEQIGMRVDVPLERVIMRYYRFTRFAGIPSLDWERELSIPSITWARLRLSTTLQYEVERVQLEPLGEIGQLLPTLASVDQSRLRFPEGTFALQSVRLAQTLDFRDNPTNPTRGVVLSLTGERTWDIFTQDKEGLPGAPIQTLRVSGSLSGYIPMGRNVVWALSTRAGRIFLLDENSRTIAPKRFFLGGASSLRGFREDGVIPSDRRADLRREVEACRALVSSTGCTEASVALLNGREVPSEGGELFFLGKSELRIPLAGSLDLGLFVESGNLWLSSSRFSWSDWRYVTGAGIRWITPIGPLALDLGVNPFRDAVLNEPTFNIHFNIGLF